MYKYCPACAHEYTDNRWPRTCGACGHTVYRNPLPVCVALVHLAHDGGDGFLLVERMIEHPGWAAPGGYMDYGETPTQAVARELHEETNLRIEPESFEPFHINGPGGTALMYFITHVGEIDLANLRGLDGETGKMGILYRDHRNGIELSDIIFDLHAEALKLALAATA